MKRFAHFLLITGLIFSFGCSQKQPPIKPRSEGTQRVFIHTVNYPGETLQMISAWYTKSSSNWEDISLLNESTDPKHLIVGEKIKIPENLIQRKEQMPSGYVSNFLRRSFAVKKDTAQDKTVAPETKKELESSTPIITNKEDPLEKRKQQIRKQTREELLRELGE